MRRSFDAGAAPSSLALWERASRPGLAYGLLVVTAVGYAVVARLLWLAGARPMPDPWLPIPHEAYFYWGTFFYAPVILVAWWLGTSWMHLLAMWFGGKPRHDTLRRGTAFATGLGTLATLGPDLVTSPLRMFGVVDERAWETSILSHSGWFAFTWVTLILYLVLFLVLYPLAARQATTLSWPKAIVTGVSGFAAFQGFEYVFIR